MTATQELVVAQIDADNFSHIILLMADGHFAALQE